MSSESTHPRARGAPALQPLPENILTLAEAGDRRRRLDLAHDTLSLVQSHFTLTQHCVPFQSLIKIGDMSIQDVNSYCTCLFLPHIRVRLFRQATCVRIDGPGASGGGARRFSLLGKAAPPAQTRLVRKPLSTL